jgi:hypothetical protein
MPSLLFSAGAIDLVAALASLIAVGLAYQARRLRQWFPFALACGGGVSCGLVLLRTVAGMQARWQELADGLAPALTAHGVVLVALAALFTEVGRRQGARLAVPERVPFDRARAIGSAGETLVAFELARLGYPALHNVILCGRGWIVEIDHLVRMPDGIVVLETKTWSGTITGDRQSARWTQHKPGAGHSDAFLNPVIQNGAHIWAIEQFLGDRGVSVWGYVVSAGNARFAAEIAAHVVPLGLLGDVLRSSGAPSMAGYGRLDGAWERLQREAARSGARRQAQIAHARRRRQASGGFRWIGL